MHAPSAARQRTRVLPQPLALQMPPVQFHLNQMAALAQWATALWVIGHNQMSRYATFLSGDVPLDI